MRPSNTSSLESVPRRRRDAWRRVALCVAFASVVILGAQLTQLRPAGVLASSASKIGSSTLNISVRDSMTGYGVSDRVIFATPKGGSITMLSNGASGQSAYQLSSGHNDLEVSASGYQPLKTHFELEPQSALDVTVWVDPEQIPNELRPEVIQSQLRPGYVMLHGHVVDTNGRPLQGVRVYLEQTSIGALTNSRGYFLFYAPAAVIDQANDMPATDNLLADLKGYKRYRLSNVLLPEGATHFIIDMKPGKGVTEQDATHKMMRSTEELKDSQTSPGTATDNDRRTQDDITTEAAVRPMSVSVPSSIRVGFNCSCASCSTVQVYSLDTYVRLGLEDEWIASWNANALKAGAIAYRSYGVYHVYHPRDPNYDICNTTCCQVLNPSTSNVNTDNATAATSGMIVVDSTGNNPFFAEYAAENNDNFCADGFTGSPSFNWPCMSDSVDAGQAFNGHGRGMCQWGTQRWSVNQAKDYLWIVDHYYNNNGLPSGARSGILQTPSPDFSVSASPSSQSVIPGASTTYTVTVTASGGFNGTVALSASGLPADATASFNPASVVGSGSSTMTVTTSASTPAGSSTVTITGTSGALMHTTTVSLVVTNPGADFSLSASPSSRTVIRRQSTTYTVTVTPSGGFNGTVTFAVSGLAGGATASFNPTSVNTSGSTTLTVTAGNARGTFPFTITGTSGGLQRTTSVTLTVTK
jgi:Stage II sporulation protein